MTQPIFILGGYQSDFARNWAREELSIFDLFQHTVQLGMQDAAIDPADIDVGHVANFEGSLYTGQSHLGGFFGHVDTALRYLPASRHEAACASGSMAIMAAMADLESQRYNVACVLGIEMMRSTTDGKDRLGGAGWMGQEWQGADFMWPAAFSDLIDFYQQRFGVKREHLAAISEKNFANARQNPNSQSRHWSFPEGCFESTDRELNPQIHGHIHRLDCGQVTDGAAVIFLANERGAKDYAAKHNLSLDDIPRIAGWGHVNAPMLFKEKVRLSAGQDYPFPHVRQTIEQSLGRAGMSLDQVDGIELHDCFNITEYMLLDHLGLKPQGDVWQAIEEGKFQKDGGFAVNASGGLIGLGHPVGATGVRMALDAYKQVSQQAQDMQIDNAKNILTFNVGGSTTTCGSLLVSAA